MKARCADASHPHHLAGHVDDLEALEEMTPVLLQGGPVGAELLVNHLLDFVTRISVHGFEVPRRNHHGRLADDPVAAVDHLAELGQRLEAVAGVGLFDALLGRLRALLDLALPQSWSCLAWSACRSHP